jgi:hypothetical protein
MDERKYVGFRVSRELWKVLKRLTIEEEKQMQDLMMEGVKEMLKKRGIEVEEKNG